MNKKIYKYSEVKDKILKAVDTITDPIIQTMSPKGGNVIFEDEQGNQYSSNDGVTVAKSISVKDEVENAIIEIIKGGALKTNMEVGDGTSSTVLVSSILIKEGLKLIDAGFNQMEIRDELVKFAKDIKTELSKKVIKIKDDKDIKFIAKISANNDEDIANNLVKIMKVVGLDGQVMIDKGYTTETEIIEDTGFILKSGVFAQELVNKQFQANMINTPVLITDKRLYYKSEAETILKTVMTAGYNEVVIIAQDFIGEALPFFIANHINNKVRVILIAEKKPEILEDLSIYLGGGVVSDKKGTLVDNISIENFMMAKRVFSDPHKSIISRDKNEVNKEVDKRIKSLKVELKKVGNKNSPEYGKLLSRVSSLTNGMVTIKVGGTTPLETVERIYRYEDAVNATRAAMREGYLPGAGVAMLSAFNKIKSKINNEYYKIFERVSEANIRQIAINCNKNPDSIIEQISKLGEGFGYNANSGKIEDVVKSGIIEPFLVASQVIANSISIANVILTSNYIIVNDLEDYKDNNKK